jgi:hypothetical protein
MDMKRLLVILGAVCFLAFLPAVSSADLYSGSINAGAGGGLIGTQQWGSDKTTLSWEIIKKNSLYSYSYTFIIPVPNRPIDYVIIEVKDKNLILNEQVPFAGIAGTYNSSGNEGMSGSYDGIKWNPSDTNLTSFSWSFTTENAPIWGRFYARDGNNGPNAVYLNSSDANVGVPGPVVPLPASVLLLGSGLAGLTAFRRFRRHHG